MRALALLMLVGACGSDDKFIIVTVEARPAVHDVKTLSVTLMNEGTSRTDELNVTTQNFPATFSISAPGRTGTLDIAIDALDEKGFLVGRGGLVGTPIDAPSASLLLDSADFVVNTEVAGDQFPSNDFDANGFQLSAGTDGLWTATYRDACMMPCSMFARRFDVTGAPVESALAAGTNGFAVSTDLTTGFFVTPAAATAGASTAVVWVFTDPPPGTNRGIACRALDAAGNATGPQVPVSIETSPDVVSVTALSNSSFAVAWKALATTNVIRGAIVSAQCQPSNVVQISTVPGTAGPVRSAVTSNADRVFYAWILDGDVRGRVMTNSNAALTADTPLVAKNAAERIEYVRVAPLGTGFAVVVRWVLITGSTGPGRIELYRTNSGGGLMGGPTLVTSRSGTDSDSSESFGVAQRSEDGALLVVWHSCAENGDDSGCGVFGRVLRPNGVPVGDEFVLATTTAGDQSRPSAVALPGSFAAIWKDLSAKEPDKSGAAVRARVIYPAYDDAKGVLGAACTSTADCGAAANLACGASTDGGQRCFATCNPAGLPPQCPGGGTCSIVTGGSACLF